MFAIVYKENGKAIGSLGIHESWANQEEEYKDLRVKEIGYSLSRDYWGRGLVPEAVQKVIDHFFQENLLEAFTANHFSFNNQFRRVIEKCWFRFLKRAEIYLQQTGKTYEALRYILYKKDWEGQK